MKTLETFEELISPLLLTRHSREFGFAMLVLSTLLFIFALIDTLSTWYSDLTTQPSPTVISKQNNTVDADLITQIPAQHLFGRANEDDDFLPITSLQLRLTGIIKNSDESISRVIIAEGEQPGKVYSVGDTLTSGITINSISSDGVALEHNGRLEKLPLSRSRLQFQDKPKTLWDEN